MTRVFWFIVNAAQALFVAVWTACWISAAFVVALVTFNRELPLVMARKLWAPPLIRVAGARLVIAPLPSVDWEAPHVYVMNHQSMMDIPCAVIAIPARVRFVAKHVLKYVPFLGWFMWMTKMILVDRSNRTQSVQTLRAAASQIRSGTSVLAFPEGTRSREGAILPFKKGPFALAIDAGVPIVPVAIHGSAAVLPSDGFRVRPGVVHVKLGAPIASAGRDRESLMAEVHAAVVRLHDELAGTHQQDETPSAFEAESRA